ncbi:MAG: TolC family protein [Alloprevotella sp.]|nr:TolC family protein [Alloprevotella sp.]
MRRILLFYISFVLLIPLRAQQSLTLEECRRLALENNKTLARSRANRDVAFYTRRAAETNYLPKVQVMAGYVHTGREISILNKDQKRALGTLGTDFVQGATVTLQSPEAQALLAQHPDLLPLVQQLSGQLGAAGAALNGVGAGIVDAFRTDTRNIATGAVLLTQPLYMGGKIRAYDRLTHYTEQLADYQLAADEQEVVLEVDRAYWQVVSLANKLQLAENFRNTLRKLDGDVQKMIAEGVATRANELQVAVKLNEAEMMVTKVEDGLALSRMLLGQLIGHSAPAPQLADEGMDALPVDTAYVTADAAIAFANRPELGQLQTAVSIYNEKAAIERANALPQVAFIGGAMLSNPNGFNGFRNRFAGTWTVGVTLKMPVWTWGEYKNKVKAAQAEAQMAAYQADEVREKIGLQVAQETFRVNEATKRLRLTGKNLEQAEENLRIANLGYQEGVIVLSDVLQAQTAWLQAHSDKIDAQIDIMLTRAALGKALGQRNSDGAAPDRSSDYGEREGKRGFLRFMKRLIR